MAPLLSKPEDALHRVNELIKENQVMIFSKTTCPYCTKVKSLFSDLSTTFNSLELDTMDQGEATLVLEALKSKTGQTTVPNVFVNGQHLGGCDSTFLFYNENKLVPLLARGRPSTKGEGEYDLIVIGGGSGGLACSKEAARLGKKVALLDFVKPSPLGTTWGIGGTCVNVGCMPKKLMHQGALLGEAMSDAQSFGWKVSDEKTHDWGYMVQAVSDYIKSLNWGYRVSLRDAGVAYINAFGEFVDKNTLKITDKKGVVKNITGDTVLIAVGGRPRYPDIPGAIEFGVTSDDIFSLPYNPGKTLCVGASYISLETAGFLAGLGIETTVMVRSILLRGFDQQMAELVGAHMADHGVRFLRGWVPTSIRKIEDGGPGKAPRLLVTYKQSDGDQVVEEEYNTVLFAVGRDPCTKDLNLGSVGVQLSEKTGKVLTDEKDQTNISNIYSVGDTAQDRPELTPSAILAGKQLARRLYGGSKTLTDYVNVPTTVFTPMEYGCVGLSEEDAVARYGKENIEVYHTHYQALEHALPKRDQNRCYSKLICLKSENERVIGLHYFGPNAGEVTQGYAIGLKFRATKTDFDELIGIHPTTARNFTELEITKSSGLDPMKKGCCG